MRCCMCQLHIINYSSPVIDTVSFLFTGMRGGLTSFAILSMLISGLKKKKLTVLLLRFVGTLVAGVAVGAPLSHNDTLVGSASPWACVVSNLLTRGTPGKEVKKHREEQVKDLGNRQVLCVCVCVCVC